MTESEAASEEETKVEDHWRLFRLCRWINIPFAHLMVSAEGAVAVVVVDSEAENRCEVGSNRVRRRHIGLVQSLGGDAVI